MRRRQGLSIALTECGSVVLERLPTSPHAQNLLNPFSNAPTDGVGYWDTNPESDTSIKQLRPKDFLVSILYQMACSLSAVGRPESVRFKMKSRMAFKFWLSSGLNPEPSWMRR